MKKEFYENELMILYKIEADLQKENEERRKEELLIRYMIEKNLKANKELAKNYNVKD